jgi:type I restriction enzyme S subunit
VTELPRGWVEVPLGTFATTTKNIDPARQSETVFDLYSVPAFANGLPDVVTGAEIGSTKQIVQQDDVLLCKIIPHLNRVWSVPESSGRSQIASPEWLVYRDHGCEPNYLRGALSEASFREKFLETKSGVGGSLTRARAMQVNEIPIPIAPRFEQQRIVAKVEGLTARTARARADLSRIPTLIARYKQRLLALAFSGDLTAGWRSAHSDLKSIAGRLPDDIRSKFVSTENDDFVAPYPIPFAWRWLRLPEIGDLDRGKSRHRPRNDPKLFGGPYPFVQTGDVRAANRVLTEFTITYSEFGLEQSRLWPVGTVCITIAANIAETAILGIEACFPDSVVGFLPDPGRVSGEFVEFFIRTMRSELEAFAPATAQKNINLNVLSSVRVPVPPVEEQAEIVRRIESAFGWLDRMAAHHTAAVRLMPKLDAANLFPRIRLTNQQACYWNGFGDSARLHRRKEGGNS